MKNKKNNKHQLVTIKQEELVEAYKKQIENHVWNFFDERKHVEDLLCQRFNYLILAFSLFTTAFATIDGKCNRIVILSAGIVVLTALGCTVYRAYLKLDINLKILHKLQDAGMDDDSSERTTGYNAMAIIDKEVRKRRVQLINMNKAIGIGIPLLLVVLYIIGILFIAMGWWPMKC